MWGEPKTPAAGKGRGALCVLPVALLTGLLVPAIAGAATFKVQYVGQGRFQSKYESTFDNNRGTCTETRSEDTNFSWIYSSTIKASFGPHGLAKTAGNGQPVANPLGVDNSSSVAIEDEGNGCSGGTGDRTPTSARCHGESQPWPDEKVEVRLSAAPSKGRSSLTALALGKDGLHAKDFSGAWRGSDWPSCKSYFSSPVGDTLGIPLFGFTAMLRAKFPVQVKTLEGLPRGHHFRVHIKPGHYAPSSHCATGTCSLTWHGTVRVTRTG